MKRSALLWTSAFLCCADLAPRSFAFTGTSGAAFLEVPVGARPAGLGSAYSALATDAYASVWNPAGLAMVRHPEVAAMHLAYLDDSGYEYLSFSVPLNDTQGLGGAIQYFRPGDLIGRDASANPIGSISGYYAAGTLAYGRTMFEDVCVGFGGKWIHGSIDDASASAFAGDAGLLYRASRKVRLAATLTNVGTHLKFIQNGDPLPMTERLGVAYEPVQRITLAGEISRGQDALTAFHGGVEFKSSDGHSFRMGYSTDRIRQLSGLAGLTVGMGLNLWNNELSYTWSPLSDLGQAHYVSFIWRWGQPRRNLDDFDMERQELSGNMQELLQDYDKPILLEDLK